MIDPATNINGETVPDYCQRRWGGGGWTKNLKVQGRKDGASFNNWQWWPHTLKAHQLVHYCETKHLPTNKCNALLFDAEYEQGLNLADVEVLMDVASKMEITELDELKKYLTEDEGAAEVNRAIALGRRDYEISSVPFFVIGKVDADGNPSRKPYGFSGAQGPETFLGIFEKLSSSETA
uniref:DSBA-like thioredoxin domain-containing protein n=2 Tax=Craspedostauros australis TaxID=1486917 RepID=A0A7R9ZKX6_9STRA|mmetsp:Transcript_17085/g.47324  ORF Transcript_17085/g.47324 Transcript_17085/m.47324 type:complete len:179 (+) Transcript_17085:808-1344(+)